MNYPLQRWLLFLTTSSPGAWNMAVDEALLEQVEQGQSLPCLRLYSWDPPCLSIGYAQHSTDIDFPRLSKLGWHWVRRPTGGRAILHTDELTYSVIGPLSDSRLCGGVLESYQRLSQALLSALHSLHIPAESHPHANSSRNRSGDPVCFEVPSNYEIVVNGKKIIGSAQARRKNALLQHGSFPLLGDLSRITHVLNFSNDQDRSQAASRLLAHATTAESVLGQRLSWQAAAQAFISAFHSELNLELMPQELPTQITERAKILVQKKYAQSVWLERI